MHDQLHEVPLTPTEFRLLARLLAQPGEAVRRRDLVFLVLSAMITMLVIVALSPALRLFFQSTWDLLH